MFSKLKFKSKLLSWLAKIGVVLGGIDIAWDLLGKIVTTFFSPPVEDQTITTTFVSFTTTTTSYITTTMAQGPNYTTLLPFTGSATSVSLNGASLTFTPLPYGLALIIMTVCILIWVITK